MEGLLPGGLRMAVGPMVVPQFGHGVPNAAFVVFGHFGHFK
jgi:hypothetical protein